jgi:hypothetical protein
LCKGSGTSEQHDGDDENEAADHGVSLTSLFDTHIGVRFDRSVRQR